MNKNTIIAVDLGSTHIRAIAAEERENNILHILGVEEKTTSNGVQYGIAEKVTNIGYDINECIKLLKNQTHIADVNSAFVAIGGRGMQLVETSVNRYLGNNRLISDKLLEDMENECKEKTAKQDVLVFDVIPQYFLIDNNTETENPEGQKASEIKGFYKILVGNPKSKENTQRSFDRTGIVIEYDPNKIDAISAALLDDRDRDGGCAIIDFGGETTTLSIFKNRKLQHVCVVPLGGRNITKDIQSLGISEQNAEKLKKIKGQAMESMVQQPVYIQIPSIDATQPAVRINTKFLAKVIEARLSEILNKIFIELKEYETALEGDLILTGGGCMLHNIVDFVQQYTNLQVRIGSHNEWLSQETLNSFWAPDYSQLIGTLVLGSSYQKEHKNEEVKTPKIPKSKKFFDNLTNGVIKFFDEDSSI